VTENIGWAELGVRPDTTGFSTSLSRQVDPAMDAAGRRSASRFSAGFKRAAVGISLGIVGAATAGIRLAASSLDEAREAQKVGALTASTIRATGGAAKVTAAEIEALSGRLSEKAGIDDEVIQSGANMLLTFKNIRNEAGESNKIFDQSLTTLVDLSAAMGTDAKSAAIQLGKALNDPVRGITALTRVGVTFDEQQKRRIAQYVEEGNVAKAQKVILAELSSEFGGAAAAQATESDKLDVALGNLKETIGTELLPYVDDFQRIIRQDAIPATEHFFGFMEKTGVPAIKKVAGFLGDAASRGKDLVGFLDDLPDPAKYAGLVALVGGVGAAKLRGGSLGGGGALGTAGRALGLAKPVPVFVTNQGFGAGGSGFGGGGGGKGIGSLPGIAPFIPIGVGGKIESQKLPLPPEFKKNFAEFNKSWDDFAIHAKGAFEGVELAIDHATPILKRYQRVLDGTPRQIKTWVGLSGYEKAIGQIRTLQAGIDALAQRGLDNGVPFVHGGVNINSVNVQAHDYNDFLRQTQRRSQQAALGGRR